MKALVAYFSASGVTAAAAKRVAGIAEADLFEIKPTVSYTAADLDWMNSKSRSSVEMKNKSFRPSISGRVNNMAAYDTLFVGFPIWWYVAPTIINTFLESYDLSGKRIILFATSGGSDFGKTVEELQPSCPNARITHCKLINRMSNGQIEEWLNTILSR